MSIVSTDILLRLTGGSANSSANASLGGVRSTTSAPAGLFDAVSAAEAAAGSTEYRCVSVVNNHGSITLTGALAWVVSDTPDSGSIIHLGLGTSAVNGNEQTIANETTAPTGVTFSAAASKGAAIALGDIPAGQSRALWVKRIVSAGAAPVSGDTYSIRIEGSTV